MLGFGYVLGLPLRHRTRWRRSPACLLVMCLAFCLSWMFVLLGHDGAGAGRGAGHRLPVMFPLTFGTNVFVPTDTLPGWLQAWVKVNPVTAPGRRPPAG